MPSERQKCTPNKESESTRWEISKIQAELQNFVQFAPHLFSYSRCNFLLDCLQNSLQTETKPSGLMIFNNNRCFCMPHMWCVCVSVYKVFSVVFIFGYCSLQTKCHNYKILAMSVFAKCRISWWHSQFSTLSSLPVSATCTFHDWNSY